MRPITAGSLLKSNLLTAAVLLCAVVPWPVLAQGEDETEESKRAAGKTTPASGRTIEEIIVTGTRMEGRSPTAATSPVDVFGAVSFERQLSFDFTDHLRNISPSFNTQRFPIADGTSFIRPANLRNLSPDQTLVLVNGHRRHRSALVNLQVEPFGTVNQGAQAVDFGLIPSAAIDRIEVLRDGSSAQYGSDAIAGVINIILKDNPRGLTVTQQGGQTYDGDGDQYRTSVNLGLPVTDDGFLNATWEFIQSDFTSRGSARPDAVTVGQFVGRGQVPFDGLGQRWGDPNVDGHRLFFNGEFGASKSVRAYGHGSYAAQDFDSSFFYRTPVGVPGVGPRATLFVDNDGDGRADPVPQSILDEINRRGLNPNDFVTADRSSPTGFVALNPIASGLPGGYAPTFGAEVRDFEGVLGLKGEWRYGLRWDVSGRFGENHIEYSLLNSINPSLGINSPRDFRPGTLEQNEQGTNVDFVLPVGNTMFASPVNFAFGAEWRRETYVVGVGDPESFESGPTAPLFGVGSDGFQGDSPDAAGTFRRDSYAGYGDVELDVIENLAFGVAGRLEDSEDFDLNTDWKVSARYQPHPLIALRGTSNTGFRAPTPGQINTLDVTTTADASGRLVPLGTFPVNSRAAIALGAEPLKTENSFGFTGGLVLTPLDDFTLTVDYYNIDIDDRIALANFSIEPGAPEQQALIDAGVENAELLGSVSFFSNAVDTTVQGVEIVAIYEAELGEMGSAWLDARHAFNDQDVDRVKPGTIDAERVFDLENQLPNHRSVFTIDYRSPWNADVILRANRFGEWEDLTFGEVGKFDSEWLFDLVVTYRFLDRYRLAVGGENIFDALPDDETNSVLRFIGATRPVSSPFGFNGGIWFARLSVDIL